MNAFLAGVQISRKLHLHARAIRMPHPAGGELFAVAPIPTHMEESFKLLGFDQADGKTPFVAFDME